MNVRKIMIAPAVTVKPNISVIELAKLMAEKRISGVPVVEESGKLAVL